MENRGKKVIAFIVEGSSDGAVIGSVMKEYFSNEQIQSVVVHGDVTTGGYVGVGNIIRKINDLVSTLKEKYRYKTSDFTKIIHLTDTDGVFISNECVWPAGVDSIAYYEDHIEVRSREAILDHNHKKSEILFKPYKTGKIGTIPYNIYYNSCSLEHVLFNGLKDFTNEEKEEMSDEFADKYEQNPKDSITFLSEQQVAVPGTYQDTWKFIEEGLNSLQRHTNMHRILEGMA